MRRRKYKTINVTYSSHGVGSVMHFSKNEIKLIKEGIKTQTRRPYRGYYKHNHKNKAGRDPRAYKIRVGHELGNRDIKIVFDKIHSEYITYPLWDFGKGQLFYLKYISEKDALAEGNYTPYKYEQHFREKYPNWNITMPRWVFEFHVVKRYD